MKCKNYLFSVLFAFLGVFFGSFIINQNNTYAVDYTSCPISIPTGTYSTVNFRNSTDCTNYSLTSGSSSSNKYILTIVFKDSGGNSFPIEFYTRDSGRLNAYAYNSYQFRIDPVYIGSSYHFQSGISYQFVFYDSVFDTEVAFRYAYIYTNWSYVESAIVDIYPPDNGSTPSGSLEITENGTYDVTDYAEAVVNVPETECPPSSGGNYHEDLVAINNSIMICAATCLVIYFFYCIYRMIIKNSGVK